MKYFLDTNICIYAIKRRPETIIERLRRLHPREIGLSSITVAELRYGADNSFHPVKNHHIVDAFLSPFSIEAFTQDAAEHYGRLVTHLKKNGTPIGTMDALIAAHALAKDVILVSNNLKEFKRVPGLKHENWIE